MLKFNEYLKYYLGAFTYLIIIRNSLIFNIEFFRKSNCNELIIEFNFIIIIDLLKIY